MRKISTDGSSSRESARSAAKRGWATSSDTASRRGLSSLLRLLEGIENAVHFVMERLSRLGQAGTASIPSEKAHAESIFELRDRPRQRRLFHVYAFGSAAKM